MKTNEPTQSCQCAGQCCGTSKKNNLADVGNQSGQIRAGFGNALNWTDGMRPFLGFYVFKG
jgi:hypothetical protein